MKVAKPIGKYIEQITNAPDGYWISPGGTKSLPNQEPVERWELEFDEKFNSIAVFYDEKNKEYFAAILPKDRVENDEYGLEDIKKFISHQKALSRAEVLEEVERVIRSFIAVNQQNRAYNEKQEPYTDRIELLDTVIKLLGEKKL